MSARTTTPVSLRFRWTAALLVLGALPLCALAAVTLRILHDALQESEAHLEVAALDRATDSITTELNAAADGTLRVGRALTEGRIVPPEARIELAEQCLAEAPGLSRVTIYAPTGDRLDSLVDVRASAAPEPPERLAALTENLVPEGQWLDAEASPQGPILR